MRARASSMKRGAVRRRRSRSNSAGPTKKNGLASLAAGLCRSRKRSRRPASPASRRRSLRRGHFGIDRLVVPVAIVVVRVCFLAAVAGRDVVHVHDRHDEDFRMLPQPGASASSLDEPLDQAARDPTRTALPGMLPCLHPEAAGAGSAAFAHMQAADRATFAGAASSKAFACGEGPPRLRDQRVGVAGVKGGPHATHSGPPSPDDFINDASPCRRPFSVCRQVFPSVEKAARAGIAQFGASGLPVSWPWLRRDDRCPRDRASIARPSYAVHAKIPPARPAAPRIAARHEPDDTGRLIDRLHPREPPSKSVRTRRSTAEAGRTPPSGRQPAPAWQRRRRGAGDRGLHGGILNARSSEMTDRDHRSERIGADDLAAGDAPQRPPGLAVHGALDEPHRAVAEQGVHAAGVVAPRRDRREGRPAGLLALAREVQVGVFAVRAARGSALFGGQAVVKPVWWTADSTHSLWPSILHGAAALVLGGHGVGVGVRRRRSRLRRRVACADVRQRPGSRGSRACTTSPRTPEGVAQAVA